MTHRRASYLSDRRTFLTRALTLPAVACAATALAAPPAADTFLDPAALHDVSLTLTPAAWQTIQPTRKGLLSNLFPTSRPAGELPKHASPFGYEYAWARAAVTVDRESFADAGLRHKGNSSYMTAPGLKRPFKLDLDKFVDGQALACGATSLNLNNNALDPTLTREPLAYEAFRAAGVPAPRTAFALVRLTIPGQHDRKLLGLYTLVEEVNKAFLKRHFGSAKGLLLKPEGALNWPYQGETFDRYVRTYRPKDEAPKPVFAQRLVDLVTLTHRADDATFTDRIGQFIDADALARFLAVSAVLANLDSPLSTGHNFYLYLHPDTLAFHFVPWDLNLSFGAFDWVGSPRQQAELSVRQPFVRPNRLFERFLAIDAYAKAYRAEVRRVADACLAADKFHPRVDAARGMIAEAERRAGVRHTPLPPGAPPEWDAKVWAARRVESIRDQLAGRSEGYAPYWQKGFFARPQRPATRPTTRKS